ncbi:hypothetical protein H8K33_15240 [Undibacterium amnicola]|uniref:Uncharacterized protein n=1 Tax=Undibacterium amnicola TaxID=1834038 RepID=A0ABR6XU23_9BURK|nr:hypothetical protein [Undibacterium amnicola]MBC3832863.1 hypothetical protein [Undibacterium amnicola]
MARPTPQLTAALDILDWLHFNQALVYSVFSEEDVFWLRKIFERVKAAVAATRQSGIDAEIMKHYVLCYLEIFLSDGDSIGFSEAETYEKVLKYNKIFFSAMVNAKAKSTGKHVAESALTIATELCIEFRTAPATVRFRLTERCMVYEFPNAAMSALKWFVEAEAISSAKYKVGTRAHEKHRLVVVRIGLLCELKLTRIETRRAKSPERCKPRRVVEQLFDNVIDKLQSPIEKILIQQAGKLWMEKLYDKEPPDNSIHAFLINHAFERDYVAQFLNQISTVWKHSRFYEATAAAWPSIIGAFDLVIAKFNNEAKKIYESRKNTATSSDDVSKTLLLHGFTIQARTLYLHHREFNQVIQPRIKNYYASLQSSKRVIAAEDEDFWYFILCTTS